MPNLDTRAIGPVAYNDSSLLHFPAGLPAFEQCRRFLLLERDEVAPFLFLQSADDPGLSFPLLPAHAVDGAYLHPDLEDDDRARLGPLSEPPLCYFVVTIHPGAEPTANLLAPIVVNWPARRGVQAVQTSTAYSHQHLLRPAQPATGEGKSSIC